MTQSASDLNRLGIAHAQRQQFIEAAQCFRKATLADPTSAVSFMYLGGALSNLGDFPSAKAAYQQALALEPNSSDTHFYFGLLLLSVADHPAAAACFERARKLAPNHAAAHAWSGIALARLDRHNEAIGALRRAIELSPNDAELQSNLGAMLVRTGDYRSALNSFEVALRLRPDLVEARYNYAGALKQVGLLAESLSQFDLALSLRPDYQEALVARANTLLLAGDYARGWQEYDRRLQDPSAVRHLHRAPIWDGSPLAGRTLLLEAEQGLGDTIQFVRYAQEIKTRQAGQVIVAVQPELVPLLTGLAGADVLTSQEEPRPAFDLWIPLLSLPRVMGHDPTCFPAPIPYLKANPSLVEHWKARLANIEGFKIGIAWQGNKRKQDDYHRSFHLRSLAPVARIPGVTLLSLQKGDGLDQLASFADFKVLDFGNELDVSGGAFMDTAALMRNLDLVISADTSICHLAGALGTPVWLALTYAPDWRWTMKGEHTSAYPTMRLFRQPKVGDWSSVFQRMAIEVESVTARRG